MLWFVLLVLWPLAELFVIIKVAEAIGLLWMLILLVITWPLGTRILSRQGRVVWRRFVAAIRAGRIPTEEALSGSLVLASGLLLIVPGFISDAIGLLLLAPPTRALAHKTARRHVRARARRRGGFRDASGVHAGHGFGAGAQHSGKSSGHPDAEYDVDGSAIDLDGPELNR